MNEYLGWRDRLRQAIDHRFFDIFYLDQRIMDGTAFLWATDHAAAVVEIKTYPTGTRVVHCMVGAGDAAELRDVIAPGVEQWGRAQGCAFAEIASRPGWQKHMKNRGYEPHQVAVIKEL